MTNSISSDGILTRPPATEPNNRRREAPEPSDRRETTTGTTAHDTDVGRAQQRLTQEADRAEPNTPDGGVQAQTLAQVVNEQITTDPKAALRAMGLVSETLFEAATARPTA